MLTLFDVPPALTETLNWALMEVKGLCRHSLGITLYYVRLFPCTVCFEGRVGALHSQAMVQLRETARVVW